MTGLTYVEIGATGRDDLLERPPGGFRPIHREALLGHGADVFARAVDETLRMGIQRRSGMPLLRRAGLLDGSTPVRVGDRGILRLGPVRIPFEVVVVVDEPRRRGFAYGTLRGHPESGEESFVVEHRDDDSVHLVIRAFSRPSHPLLWPGYPLMRALQEIYTRRYLRALR